MKLPKRLSGVSSRWVTICLLFVSTVTLATASIAPIAFASVPEKPTSADKATWVNATTINYGGKLFVDSEQGQPWVFYYTQNVNGDTCRSSLTFTVDPYSDTGGQSVRTNIDSIGTFGCGDSPGDSSELITLAAREKRLTTTTGEAVDPTDDTATADPELECDIKFNPLTWLLCPIARSMQNAVGQLDNQINNLLSIKTETYFGKNGRVTQDCSNTYPAGCYYKAWSVFRTIALAILVVAGLVMVTSQALGFELLDAYTIRKVLPRLLLAIIGITLSWQIVVFLIQLFNDLGNGMRAIIYAPFSGLGPIGVADGWAGFATYIIASSAFLSLGVMGLLSFAATAFLAVLIAFFLLVLREVAILFLAILSPLAIAFYILPNTQKAWKFWWGTFSKLLLLFPIIAGFIAIGRVFAQVASASADAGGGDVGGTIGKIIALIAYFAPYFLIPTAFRLAGGTIATIAGVANDRSRGGFDRLKNFRNNTRKDRGQRLSQGILYNESNPLARGVNRFGVMKTGLARSPLNASPRRMRQYISQNSVAASAELMNSQNFKTIQENDDALHAATYQNADAARDGVRERVLNNRQRRLTRQFMADGATEEDAQARSAQAVANDVGLQRDATETANNAVAVMQASGLKFGQPLQIAAAKQLVNTGTGYDNIEDMAQTLARAGGTNRSTLADLSGFANAATKAHSRNDLAPGFGGLLNLVEQEAGTAGAGRPTAEQYHTANVEALKGVDATTALRNKTPAVANFAETAAVEITRQQTILNTTANANERQAAELEIGRLNGLVQTWQQSGMYASTNNIQTFHEGSLNDATRQGVAAARPILENQRQNGNANVQEGYNQTAPARYPGQDGPDTPARQ